MFEFIKDAYLKRFTSEQLKNYYAEQGINMKKASKLIKQLEKKNKVLEVEKTSIESKGKMVEDVKDYYESQGIEPQLKDETFLEYVASNLQKSSDNLEVESENIKNKLAEYELESEKLQKESKSLNKKIEVQKHNVVLFKKTLDKQFEIKDLDSKLIDGNILKADCKRPEKALKGVGSIVGTLQNGLIQEGKRHIGVVSNIDNGSKTVSKQQEVDFESTR